MKFIAIIVTAGLLTGSSRSSVAQQTIAKNGANGRVAHGRLTFRFSPTDTESTVKVSLDRGDVLAIVCSAGVRATFSTPDGSPFRIFDELTDSGTGTIILPESRHDDFLLHITNNAPITLDYPWKDHPKGGSVEYWLAPPASAALSDSASLPERFAFFAEQLGLRFYPIRKKLSGEPIADPEGEPSVDPNTKDFTSTANIIRPYSYGSPEGFNVESTQGKFSYTEAIGFDDSATARSAYDTLLRAMKQALPTSEWTCAHEDASDDNDNSESDTFESIAEDMPKERISISRGEDNNEIIFYLR